MSGDIKGKEGDLIVSFIHSNYITKAGGTEHFVNELSEIYRKLGFNHLCFFAFVKQKGSLGEEIIGANWNDKFVGIYPIRQIKAIISHYALKYGCKINSYHIQHLMNHNLDSLKGVLAEIPAKIVYFVHDFYSCCCSEHLIDSKGVFCGEERPSEKKCRQCRFWEREKGHLEKFNGFFEAIRDQLHSVIVPSNYVKRVFANCYPTIAEKIIVRPHLVPTRKETLQPIDGHVKLAYIGRQRKQKGYEQWKEIISTPGIISNPAYKLFYLGMDEETHEGVKNIGVLATVSNPTAMKDAIKANGIVCAFLWPQCAETYSYVYYELIESGVYILTNNYSGNIADEVLIRKNGRIFKTIEACIGWMENASEAIKEINGYRKSSSIETGFVPNRDTTGLFIDGGLELRRGGKTIIHRDLIFTALYYLKFRRNLR